MHITIDPTYTSILMASLFKTMLKISGTICLSTGKQNARVHTIHMGAFSYDLLRKEYERRYDSIAVSLRIALQHGWDSKVNDMLHHGNIEEAEQICHAILQGNFDLLVNGHTSNTIQPRTLFDGPRILRGCIALS